MGRFLGPTSFCACATLALMVVSCGDGDTTATTTEETSSSGTSITTTPRDQTETAVSAHERRCERETVTVIVYLEPDVTTVQTDAVEAAIDASDPQSSHEYVDQDAAYSELVELFGETNPDFVDAVEPEMLPPSFRVRTSGDDAALRSQLIAVDGVREVITCASTQQAGR